MKKFKFKSMLFVPLIVLLLCTGIFSIISSSSDLTRIDYEAPIPLGAEIDLISGLSEEQIKEITENYYKYSETEYGRLENIRYNFMQSIDTNKYYSGAYWDGVPYLLDENGEQLLDESGRALKNFDRDLHILVTDIRIVPKEITNPKVFFHEVKYSEYELLSFISIIEENFISKGLAGVALETKENRLEIMIRENFDLSLLSKLVPDDVYYLTLIEEDIIGETLASPLPNGGEVTLVCNADSSKSHNSSIGFPITWGSGGTNKGWLMSGHGACANSLTAKYLNGGNPNPISIGTTGNKNIGNSYDAATILRTNTDYKSSPDGPFGIIDLQESTTASLPIKDTWVDYKGKGCGAISTSIEVTSLGVDVTNSHGTYYVGGLVIVYSTGANDGDSGGPVVRDNVSLNPPEYTYTAVGIITVRMTSGSYKNQMGYSRLKNIRAC